MHTQACKAESLAYQLCICINFVKKKICIYSKDCLLFPMGIMVVIKILKSLKSVFTSNPLKKSAKI